MWPAPNLVPSDHVDDEEAGIDWLVEDNTAIDPRLLALSAGAGIPPFVYAVCSNVPHTNSTWPLPLVSDSPQTVHPGHDNHSQWVPLPQGGSMLGTWSEPFSHDPNSITWRLWYPVPTMPVENRLQWPLDTSQSLSQMSLLSPPPPPRTALATSEGSIATETSSGPAKKLEGASENPRCEARLEPAFVRGGMGSIWTETGYCTRKPSPNKTLPPSLNWCSIHKASGFPYKQLMKREDPFERWTELKTQERVDVMLKCIKVLRTDRNRRVMRAGKRNTDYTLEQALTDLEALKLAAKEEPYPNLAKLPWVPLSWTAQAEHPRPRKRSAGSEETSKRNTDNPSLFDSRDKDDIALDTGELSSDPDDEVETVDDSGSSVEEAEVIRDTIIVCTTGRGQKSSDVTDQA